VLNALEQLIAGGAITIPQRKLMALEGLSVNMLIGLYRRGEVDTIVIGERLRRVVLRSYVEYLRRRQLGIPRDEAERQTAIRNYRQSLLTKGAENAARARTGITPETRARGRRSAAALHEEPRRLAPQQQMQERRQSSESKPPATLKDSVTIT
jgi:hypothetical protein